MKLTNEIVIGILDCIDEIKKSGIDLRVKAWAGLNTIKSVLGPTKKAYDDTIRDLVESYALRDGDGNIIGNQRGGVTLKDGQKYMDEKKTLDEDWVDVEFEALDKSLFPDDLEMKGSENILYLFEYIIKK